MDGNIDAYSVDTVKKRQTPLFRGGRNYRLNACAGLNGGPYDYSNYADGYFEAAQRLIESLRENERRLDCLIYPVVFNFRHGVELSLKHLNHVLPRLWGEQTPTKWTHKLTDNWASVRSYLTRDQPSFDPDGSLISFASNLVAEFAAIDPSGEVFRFPRAKSGAHFLLDYSIINVEVLDGALGQAKELFDWWDFTAGRLWDLRCEAIAE